MENEMSITGIKGGLSKIIINAEEVTLKCNKIEIELDLTSYGFGEIEEIEINGVTFKKEEFL